MDLDRVGTVDEDELRRVSTRRHAVVGNFASPRARIFRKAVGISKVRPVASVVLNHQHVAIVGPVGVGKTFLSHALGHLACRRGASVLAVRTDKMLKALRHARLDNSYEAELRKLLAVDLLVIDDFGLDAMDHTESRDAYDLITERHRAGSTVVTSNRGPDEWLATFADPVRAQSAIDRFTSNSYDLLIEGESYRPRLKPQLASAAKSRS